MALIRVLIADDHNTVRKGLVALLEGFEDLKVIGEAGDGEVALNACRESCPDVVLMDMIMPRMDGISATSKIRAACPGTQVIALTSSSDESNVKAALRAGAIGYLTKNVSALELATAIRRAHSGQPTPEATQTPMKDSARSHGLGYDLTERERDVLVLMKEGLNNREIGERLVISSATVKNHVSNILSKLGTTSRAEAVALAVEHHIIA